MEEVITLNQVIETMIKRRSIRKYKQDQISDEELAAILDAGVYAPSGGNNQTSHIIVIQNKEALEKIKHLVKQEFSKMEIVPGMYKSMENSIRASQKGDYDFFYNAPTLIIVANQKGYGNAMADCACVLENMMIAAASLKVGSCWINQLRWLDKNSEIRNKLYEFGLLENETVCGGLSLGYPNMTVPGPLKRTGNLITYIR